MDRITRPAWGANLALLLVLICGICRPASASIVYVNKASTAAAPDGKTWTTAFTSVQPAIDASKSGDEVWVAGGTYIEALTLKAGVGLYGGFSGTEASRSQRNVNANSTVLSGTTTASAVVTTAADGGVLDGFTVRNGYQYGILSTSGMTTVAHCRISGSSNGVFVSGGTVHLAVCIVSGCPFSGVEIQPSTTGMVNLASCTVAGNGYGIYTVPVGNTSFGNRTISATNCTITANIVGVLVEDNASADITNCIVASNGTGISHFIYETGVTLSHNDVYGNSLGNYVNITDPTGSNGNISRDPLLSSPYHDVHIQPSSPCIDAGDDAAQPGGTDIDGQPRIIGAHVDIGSDESDGTVWTVPSQMWHVSPTGDDANSGTSWLEAKKTVAGALAVAQGSDEVWVAKGTYTEYMTTSSLHAGVALYGGFAGTETVRSQRDWTANETVLDGAGKTAVGVSTQGVIADGFTIRNGANAVFVAAGMATITNCNIFGNSTGIRVWGTATITNCKISGISSGVYAEGSTTISNCTISGSGDGVRVFGGTATLLNCIVAFNGTGVSQNADSYRISLSHTDVYGNSTANYVNVPDAAGTLGNISVDPLFVDRTGGDYHLLPGSPCRDAGNDSLVPQGGVDLDGNPRIAGSHVDMGAYEIQPQAPWSTSLGTTVIGGVTVAEKVAYVAGNDGQLYARSTVDGSAVAGFPVDISAAVGATVMLPSRPAVYYGKTGKAIYLTTDRGDVVRVLPTGQVAWHVRPLTGQTVSTPAVTPDGYVYVNLSTGSGPFDNFVFKLDEATGTPLSLSPFLGYTTADNIGDFSPAANNRYLYVNSGWGSKSGLTLLNQDNLAVRSSFAGGEQCLSPLLLGSDLLLASKGGKAWKMNAVTLAPDLGFGHFGVANLGAQISAAPFSDGAGNVYIGTADGRILKWVPGSGSFTPFYTATGKIAGLTIDRTAGVLGFGTSGGAFVQVPLSQPTSASTVTPGGPISTGTVYESLTDRFIVVTDTGVLSGYPAIR